MLVALAIVWSTTSCSEDEATPTTYTLTANGSAVAMTDEGGTHTATVAGVSTDAVQLLLTASTGETYSFSSNVSLEAELVGAEIGASVISSAAVSVVDSAASITLLSASKVQYDWKPAKVNLMVTLDAETMNVEVEAAVVEAVVKSPIDPDNLACTDTDFETLYAFGSNSGKQSWGWGLDETALMERDGDSYVYTWTKADVQSHYGSVKFVNSLYWADAEWAVSPARASEDGNYWFNLVDEMVAGTTVVKEFDLDYRKIDVELDEEGNKVSEEKTECGPESTGQINFRFLTDTQVDDGWTKPVYDIKYTIDALNHKMIAEFTVHTSAKAP